MSPPYLGFLSPKPYAVGVAIYLWTDRGLRCRLSWGTSILDVKGHTMMQPFEDTATKSE